MEKYSSQDKPESFSSFFKKCWLWFQFGIIKQLAFSLEYFKIETFCSSLIADLLSRPLRWLIEEFGPDKVQIWKPFSLSYSLHYSLFPTSRLIRNVLQRNEQILQNVCALYWGGYVGEKIVLKVRMPARMVLLCISPFAVKKKNKPQTIY